MNERFFLRLAVLIVTTAYALPASSGEAPKIAVIDVEKTLSELQSWQEFNALMSAEAKLAEQKLMQMKKEVDRLEAELAYFKPDSSDYQERRAVVQERMKDLSRAGERAYRAIEEKGNAAVRAELARIQEHVRKFAAAEGYDLILDSRAAIYIAGGRDISFDIAREMNKLYKETDKKDSGQSTEREEATESK